ncbi:MAG: beta-Ala-His dipeptidase, partial [Defluviitaleaceae bacterium]|nr:beta-Ala-His dipeptidase [Defluviitaleaceae bacterium]
NLIIKKPASKGYSKKPAVILQAHLDMVCEKNANTPHDFARDPIDTYIDGDYIKARGTTLGADNGIGVALCMALLQSKLEHPPLEILLTSDEEAGMSGAQNLDTSRLSGTRMINLDSGDESTFTVGCAAAITGEIFIADKYEHPEDLFKKIIPPILKKTFKIVVRGLKGGHSGVDIDKERGNALNILAFLLSDICGVAHVEIKKISGGMKVNAIPREAECEIVFEEEENIVSARLEELRAEFKENFRVSEPELEIMWSETEATAEDIPISRTQTTPDVLQLLPNGVAARSLEIDGLVNASCNIGVVETTDDGVKISLMARGATEFHTRKAEAQILAAASLSNTRVDFTNRSPAWPYNPDSALLKTSQDVYKRVFSRNAAVSAVHAGLECGIFIEKMPHLEIISFGPNMYDYHTPDERLSISSTLRVWEFLCELLKEL